MFIGTGIKHMNRRVGYGACKTVEGQEPEWSELLQEQTGLDGIPLGMGGSGIFILFFKHAKVYSKP